MGSTGLHRDKGQTNLDFFNAEVTGGKAEFGEILAEASIGGVFYDWKTRDFTIVEAA